MQHLIHFYVLARNCQTTVLWLFNDPGLWKRSTTESTETVHERTFRKQQDTTCKRICWYLPVIGIIQIIREDMQMLKTINFNGNFSPFTKLNMNFTFTLFYASVCQLHTCTTINSSTVYSH